VSWYPTMIEIGRGCARAGRAVKDTSATSTAATTSVGLVGEGCGLDGRTGLTWRVSS